MDSTLLLILTFLFGACAFGCFKTMSDAQKEGKKESGILLIGGFVFLAATFFSFFTYSGMRSDEKKEEQKKEQAEKIKKMDEEAKEHGFDSYEKYEEDRKELFNAYFNCVESIKQNYPYGADDKYFHGKSIKQRGDDGYIYVSGNNVQITNAFNAKRYIEYTCKCVPSGNDCEVNYPFHSLHRIESKRTANTKYNYKKDLEETSKITGISQDRLNRWVLAQEECGASAGYVLDQFRKTSKTSRSASDEGKHNLSEIYRKSSVIISEEDVSNPEKLYAATTELIYKEYKPKCQIDIDKIMGE